VPELSWLSAFELVAGYRAREFSASEVVDAVATRIGELEPELKAFTTLALDEARAAAHAAERAYASGTARQLEGVPLAVKDLYDTAGIRTTYGSAMFERHVPRTDAAAVVRAKAEGAIVVGKTSTHEFAWGMTSHNEHFDAGRNPWRVDRVSGGSSGGSAVALATGETTLALGSDTGGSIRIPAAFCGVIGLKPTYGRVDTKGVFPLAPSLDHAGPLARTPADTALLLSALAGIDADAWRAVRVRGLRVALCPDLTPIELVPDVQAALDAAGDALAALGANLVEVELPEAAEIMPAFVAIQRLEALTSHREAGLWPQRRDEYGVDVRSRFVAAESVTTGHYLEAMGARERVRSGFVRLFECTDLLLTPVSASSPALRGSEEVEYFGRTVPFRETVMPFTVPQNLVGLPACSLRAGFDSLGIPVGVQLTGRPGAEPVVVAAAQALYDATHEIQSHRVPI
jgi:aspartyl-tRNA(Asn)/glutamyl-tRNA(Gln) amidotransferase subunit A